VSANIMIVPCQMALLFHEIGEIWCKTMLIKRHFYGMCVDLFFVILHSAMTVVRETDDVKCLALIPFLANHDCHP